MPEPSFTRPIIADRPPVAPPFARAQLATIVAALNEVALIVAEDGMVIAFNECSNEIFQQTPVGKPLILSLRSPAVLLAVNDALLKGQNARVRHAVQTPLLRNYDVHVSPLGRLEDQSRLVLLTIHDLTHEEQVERMRADFVANASHELRTPLSSISGFIETMQGSARNDPKARDDFLSIMKAQADRMAVLIDDLLSLSRIEISEHVAPSETADLARITMQARDLLATTAKDLGCELHMELPKTLPVIGDAHQLSQVVYNLIENAIKYGASGKRVEVTGRETIDGVELSVSDKGPGIAAHHVPRLTERFYRVNVQDSRNRGGTGLGLAITKHIINRHRGKLLIESEIGIGSTFTIILQSTK